ncbi:hypothetical protein N7481_000500 [Penicillium waksmanii]|uniref:uncharacterized protein n=1 Tax=Penicillium waksmanii TaxID=69791 RepID=UPI0025487CC1|nr:uncharacterized protein N7481_000500 [Penicillium waksmanii]KAJ6000091.1 hypothetical protein N7481_000500 [Penicillium waksmanii]
MKVILAGSTGFIGRETLNQCLRNPAITSVVALSRRDLPAHGKLQVTLMKDFVSYPASVRENLKDAEACIWTIGLIPSTAFKDDDGATARRVSIEYTMAAAEAFEETCQKPFRFIYVSGAGAEQDQTKSLWVMGDYRRIRGLVESELLNFAKAHSDFTSYIVRPAMVISNEVTLHSLFYRLGPSVRVDAISKFMVELAVKGDDKIVWENSEIK